jgi:PhnB protein
VSGAEGARSARFTEGFKGCGLGYLQGFERVYAHGSTRQAKHYEAIDASEEEEKHMSTKVKPIPDGYRGATPYLCCRDAARAIEFYRQAFGASELMRMAQPDGRIGHAEIRIGEALVMLADEFPEMGVRSPQTIGGSPVSIHVYVEDVDAIATRAVAAGAKLVRPVEDQFFGDRNCTLEDPFGHVWMISTHKEDVSPEEMKKRAAKLYGQS